MESYQWIISLISTVVSAFGSIAGAGPWGVAAISLVGLLVGGGLIGGIYYIISGLNKRIDQRDMENAGADAGRTAVDLSNQAKHVRDRTKELLEQNKPTEK